jgi:hypothetical protein
VVHGIASERRLGDRGVRSEGYDHASLLRAATLWQRALERGLPVASLDWPTTLGSAIPELLPDLEDARADRESSWSDRLAGEIAPAMAGRVSDHGGDRAGSGRRGPARDAVIRGVACDLVGGDAPPRLLLVRLGGSAPILAAEGPNGPRVAPAYPALDEEICQLLVCIEWAGRLEETAPDVTGDHGFAEVHTEIAPTETLVREGLVSLERGVVGGWEALVRSNGGSAFVYARSEGAALTARAALAAEARRSGAFRVVAAEEMIGIGADPEAWFGLEAAPGFAFRDEATGSLLTPATRRGVGGYLPGRAEMDTALVAWGAGVRRGLRVPEMGLADVASTFAPLAGIAFEGEGGRALVGVLTPETLRAAGATR